MKKPIKGTYGYINLRKKRQLIISTVMFAFVAAIFITGLLLNKFSKANIFTFIAVLAALPAAKMLVNYIVLFPFHSVLKEDYEEVLSLNMERYILYTDIIVTSTEKIMNMDFLVITEDQVLGLTGKSKENREYIENYLSVNIRARELPYEVIIYSDKKRFLDKLSDLKDSGDENQLKFIKEEKELTDYIISIMV